MRPVNKFVLNLHSKIDALIERIGEGKLNDEDSNHPESIAYYEQLENELNNYYKLLKKVEKATNLKEKL